MELNKKIEARRQELAKEAKTAAAEEAKRQQKANEEAAEAKKAEEEEIQAEVVRRLSQMGIEKQPVQEPKPSFVVLNRDVKKAVDQAIIEKASARMTGAENFTFLLLLLLGIGGLFYIWWVGLGFVIWSVIYLNKCTEKHKQEILAEGELKLKQLGYPAGSPHEKYPNVVWDGAGYLLPAEGYTWTEQGPSDRGVKLIDGHSCEKVIS